jgi:hypothetical protein
LQIGSKITTTSWQQQHPISAPKVKIRKSGRVPFERVRESFEGEASLAVHRAPVVVFVVCTWIRVF